MKKSILKLTLTGSFLIASALSITSCGGNETKSHGSHEHTNASSHEHSGGHEHDHSASEEKMSEIQTGFSGEKISDLSMILKGYLELTDALIKDDSEQAGKSGEQLLIAFNGFDKSSLDESKSAEYSEIEESMIENAEHIVKNSKVIDHQREHLASLSEDMIDLILLVGSSEKLYVDFCPMANDNEGATWISKTKEISNPYMGRSMPNCGSIKKEMN